MNKDVSDNREPVVAQIVQHLSPGGIETMALDLQSRASNPDNVIIVSLEGSADEMYQSWPRLKQVPGKIFFLGKKSGLRPSLVLKLRQLLKAEGVNTIHTHHVGPLLYGGMAARTGSLVHIHTEHDAWHLDDPKRRKLVSHCFRWLQPAVVADAQLVADSVLRHIPYAKPRVIPNGIDTDRFQPGDAHASRQALGLPDEVPLIGCAARLTEVKGHNLLLDAFAGIKGETHLALAGVGPLESDLKAQAEKLEISDRVHFLGLVENMPLFHQAIDLFCLSSKMEGMPLSPLESQACNTPVVLPDVGGCSETLAPGAGALVPAGDIQALQQALSAQLAHARNNPNINTRDFVLKYANLTHMIQQYEALYREFLE
ncbi:glycosyltransferase [Spongorhabdus nitratireducens]